MKTLVSRALFLIGLGLLPLTAQAQQIGYKPDDQIVLRLSQEDYVSAKTARVVLNVVAAQKGSDASKIRADILGTAAKVNREAIWRVVSFDQNKDDAGLVRWNAQLEARLPETALGKLDDTVQSISKPGLQFKVGEIDFSPTLAEQETGYAKLREQIYAKAQEELTRINAQFKGRAYRIARVDFAPSFIAPRPVMAKAMRAPMLEMATASAAADNGGGQQTGGLAVDQKISLEATATFAVNAP